MGKCLKYMYIWQNFMENGKKYKYFGKKCREMAKNVGKCLRDTHKQQQLYLAQGQYTTNSFI